MTEIEKLLYQVSRQEISIKKAIDTAYQLGRASALSPASLANLRRTGRKPGAKDVKPRTRRTKAEMQASKQETL